MSVPRPKPIRILAVLAGCLAAASSPSNKLILQVEQKVHDTLPTRAEKRFDEIGWAAGIREAERLARLHHRPILLFTHDGKIGTGRC